MLWAATLAVVRPHRHQTTAISEENDDPPPVRPVLAGAGPGLAHGGCLVFFPPSFSTCSSSSLRRRACCPQTAAGLRFHILVGRNILSSPDLTPPALDLARAGYIAVESAGFPEHVKVAVISIKHNRSIVVRSTSQSSSGGSTRGAPRCRHSSDRFLIFTGAIIIIFFPNIRSGNYGEATGPCFWCSAFSAAKKSSHAMIAVQRSLRFQASPWLLFYYCAVQKQRLLFFSYFPLLVVFKIWTSTRLRALLFRGRPTGKDHAAQHDFNFRWNTWC